MKIFESQNTTASKRAFKTFSAGINCYDIDASRSYYNLNLKYQKSHPLFRINFLQKFAFDTDPMSPIRTLISLYRFKRT
ncbi:MAG: hypothetical protein KatS3mg028_1374 [Bacteroidia bacterium]|nr:MAG: hypothetical protein KatS3mg028_1374 [Bacteroidia bacterium]